MKVETVACDWCHDVKPAVASPTLVVGPQRKNNDPHLDLCAGHLGTLLRAFVPHKRTKTGTTWNRIQGGVAVERIAEQYNTKKQRDLVRYHKQAKPTKTQAATTRHADGWVAREASVLAAMPNGGQRLSRPEVQKSSGLTKAQVYSTLIRLVEQGLVKSHGPVGRFRTYERVAENGG